jgi:hypothetical protein
MIQHRFEVLVVKLAEQPTTGWPGQDSRDGTAATGLHKLTWIYLHIWLVGQSVPLGSIGGRPGHRIIGLFGLFLFPVVQP